jgi:hypothetical protein
VGQTEQAFRSEILMVPGMLSLKHLKKDLDLLAETELFLISMQLLINRTALKIRRESSKYLSNVMISK